MEVKILAVLPVAVAGVKSLMCWLHQPIPAATMLAGIFGVHPIYKRVAECESRLEKLKQSNVKKAPILRKTSHERFEELEE